MSLVRYVGIGRQSDFSVQFLRLGLDTHSQAVHGDISWVLALAAKQLDYGNCWVLILAVKQLLPGILDFAVQLEGAFNVQAGEVRKP